MTILTIHEATAERLLPCTTRCEIASFPYSGVINHTLDCPVHYRPAVAAALQAATEQSVRLPLIAAAPDMLEALKEISIFWSEPYTEGDGLQRHITIELIRRRLDAAISKAEGK